MANLGEKLNKFDVDDTTARIIPVAFALSGRWGERLVAIFKKGISVATRASGNLDGSFITLGKHRMSIYARRANILLMMYETMMQLSI